MHILVAPQAFKGTFGPSEVTRLIAEGARRACPDATITCLPLADGGDGLLEAVLPDHGRRESLAVRDPLGRSISAEFGWLDARTAVVESAAACGLALLDPPDRDPLRSSTDGVADLLIGARDRGATEVIVGLGGSATVDGGSGLARALGWRFLDADGHELGPGGGTLAGLDRVETGPPIGIAVTALYDVASPLLGPHGAAQVFGPQKGATVVDVERLERGLRRLVECLPLRGRDGSRRRGAGAAGGLGFGLAHFAEAHLVSGAMWVMDYLDFDRRLAAADLVITAEGSFDASSALGKGTGEVLRRASAQRVRAAVVAAHVAGPTDVPTFSADGEIDQHGLVRLGAQCVGSLLGLSRP